MRAIRMTAAVAALLTVVLIVLGAAVRATNSGLSCPDWPTCYGHWLPLPGDIPPEAGYAYYQVMLEWVHRLIAGVLLGPLVLVLAILAWRARDEAPGLAPGAIALVLLLLVQAGLGGFTVLDRNSPWSVALHLGTALLVLTAMLFILVRAGERAVAPPRGFGAMALIAWLAGFVTIVSAAMVAKSGASLACATWPDCNGAWLPDQADYLVHLNFMHRVFAALTTVATFVLVLGARNAGRPLRGLAIGAFALTVLAALLAGHGVAAEWPVAIAVAHQALAILVFVHLSLLLCHALGPAARAVPSGRVEAAE